MNGSADIHSVKRIRVNPISECGSSFTRRIEFNNGGEYFSFTAYSDVRENLEIEVTAKQKV